VGQQGEPQALDELQGSESATEPRLQMPRWLPGQSLHAPRNDKHHGCSAGADQSDEPGSEILRSELIGRHVERGSILAQAIAVVVAVAVELGPWPCAT
jgi:hypothetical protein